VYIAENGVESKMLAQGAKGSKEVRWIKSGTTYEFRLYAGKEHKAVLASVTVTRQRKQGTAVIRAAPNPVPAGAGLGATTIRWDTGDGSLGQVYIAENGVESKMLAQGAKGSKEVRWIKSGTTYEFRLYAGKERATLLGKVVVTRNKADARPLENGE
jgi:IS5 family transposase